MWWYSWALDSWPRSLYDTVLVDQGLTCLWLQWPFSGPSWWTAFCCQNATTEERSTSIWRGKNTQTNLYKKIIVVVVVKVHNFPWPWHGHLSNLSLFHGLRFDSRSITLNVICVLYAVLLRQSSVQLRPWLRWERSMEKLIRSSFCLWPFWRSQDSWSTSGSCKLCSV